MIDKSKYISESINNYKQNQNQNDCHKRKYYQQLIN